MSQVKRGGDFYVIYMNGESIYKCNINFGKTYDAS